MSGEIWSWSSGPSDAPNMAEFSIQLHTQPSKAQALSLATVTFLRTFEFVRDTCPLYFLFKKSKMSEHKLWLLGGNSFYGNTSVRLRGPS